MQPCRCRGRSIHHRLSVFWGTAHHRCHRQSCEDFSAVVLCPGKKHPQQQFAGGFVRQIHLVEESTQDHRTVGVNWKDTRDPKEKSTKHLKYQRPPWPNQRPSIAPQTRCTSRCRRAWRMPVEQQHSGALVLFSEERLKALKAQVLSFAEPSHGSE